MTPHRHTLAASLLSACVFAALQPAQLAGHPNDRPENDVSMLQAAFRIEGRLRQNMDVPTVWVDLDVAPELRWRNVTGFYKQMGVFPKVLDNMTVSADMRELLRVTKFDEEHVREMKGYLRDLGLPESSHLDLMKSFQIAYEATPVGPFEWTGCSGLLAAMPNGTVIHGRNLDYFGAEVEVNGTMLHYPEVTLRGMFTRGGEPLYTSVVWPGFIGMHTAMRFGGWSFEQNTRQHDVSASLRYGLAHPDSTGYALAARRVMETTPDFETAVERLYGLNLMAPSYFVVAGTEPYQGAVITLDAGGEHEAMTPRVVRLRNHTGMLRVHDRIAGDWNILQTNDDLNKLPLDARRLLEEVALSRSTQGMVSPEWVLREMTSVPLYILTTVLTAVYIPATGYNKVVAHPENGHGR